MVGTGKSKIRANVRVSNGVNHKQIDLNTIKLTIHQYFGKKKHLQTQSYFHWTPQHKRISHSVRDNSKQNSDRSVHIKNRRPLKTTPFCQREACAPHGCRKKAVHIYEFIIFPR